MHTKSLNVNSNCKTLSLWLLMDKDFFEEQKKTGKIILCANFQFLMSQQTRTYFHKSAYTRPCHVKLLVYRFREMSVKIIIRVLTDLTFSSRKLAYLFSIPIFVSRNNASKLVRTIVQAFKSEIAGNDFLNFFINEGNCLKYYVKLLYQLEIEVILVRLAINFARLAV